MFNIVIDYLDEEDEVSVVNQTTGLPLEELDKVVTSEELLKFQSAVRTIAVGEEVTRYAVNLSRATRPGQVSAPDFVSKWVAYGSEPAGFPVSGSGGQGPSHPGGSLQRIGGRYTGPGQTGTAAPHYHQFPCGIGKGHNRRYCRSSAGDRSSTSIRSAVRLGNGAIHEQLGRKIQFFSPLHRPRGAVLHSQSASYRQECGGRIHCGSSPLTLFRLQSGFRRVPRLHAGR